MRYLDALLRPLAALPPGLPVVAEAPAEVTEALTALGFAVTMPQHPPAEAVDPAAAWGVLVCAPADARVAAVRLRADLAPGAWLSVVTADAAGPTALVGVLEDAGYALAQLPESVTDADGGHALHVVVRRVDPGVVG